MKFLSLNRVAIALIAALAMLSCQKEDSSDNDVSNFDVHVCSPFCFCLMKLMLDEMATIQQREKSQVSSRKAASGLRLRAGASHRAIVGVEPNAFALPFWLRARGCIHRV